MSRCRVDCLLDEAADGRAGQLPASQQEPALRVRSKFKLEFPFSAEGDASALEKRTGAGMRLRRDLRYKDE